MEENIKRILLVEDDPNFGTVLKEYLSINNYEVVLAKNGMEGFEKFRKSDFHLWLKKSGKRTRMFL
jgi:DNA-binding response OmpR family regulator